MKKNIFSIPIIIFAFLIFPLFSHAGSIYGDGSPELVVTGAGKGGGPHVRIFSASGEAERFPNALFPYNKSLRSGVNVATGDIDADGQDEIIVAPKKGAGPHIRIFEKDGSPRPLDFFAFHPNSRTGVAIDSADFDGDGKDEIVAIQEAGGEAWLKIYRYNNARTVLGEWNVFGAAEVGGTVAAGDMTGDKKAEVVVGAGKGGGPQVRVFKADGSLVTQFFAFEKSYRGGIDVSIGDTNADLISDTIAVSKLEDDSSIKLFSISGSTVSLSKEFKGFDSVPIGAHVDMSDVDGDFIDDVIVSAAKNGGPHVRVFNKDGVYSGDNFFAYDSNFRGGVDVAGGFFNQNNVLVGAGDISGCAYNEDEKTAALIDSIDGTVFTAGDNVYNTGSASEFSNCYEPTWGRHKNRTKPSPGNHDYETAGATGYFDYFGSAAGDRDKGYYSYDIGPWHVLSLNSNCSKIGGCAEGSAQEMWLKNDLAQNKNYCTLAYFHHPRYSSFKHGNNIEVLDLWKTMYAGNVDVIVNGHEHAYERFGLQDPFSLENLQDGIQQFIVGTGGNGLYRESDIKDQSEVRINSDHGVIKFDLKRDSYSWNFISTSGSVLDEGEMSCR